MNKSEDWDDKEKSKIRYKEKWVFKKDQIKQVLGDAYGFRFLYFIFSYSAKIQLDTLRKVCEDAHEKLGIPQNADDAFQIQEYIFTEMKKIGWNF